MPENTTPKPSDEEDDIRALFAGVEGDSKTEAVADELPPVPQLNITRPAPSPEPGDAPTRVLGGGMMGGGNMRSSGAALTIGTSLVASIVVGTGLGWLADKYLLHSTQTPWGLIVGFMIGVASGFMNLIRVANQLNKDG